MCGGWWLVPWYRKFETCKLPRVAELQLGGAHHGDIVVGKHIGRMMAMLGGRLTAYREALVAEEPALLDAALLRNLYRGVAPAEPDAVGHVRRALTALHEQLAAIPLARLMTGELP